MITQERLKELIEYDGATGEIKGKVTRGRAKAGTLCTTKTADGYYTIKLDGTRYLQHRIAWMYANGGDMPNEIDHQNHNTLDNSIGNLRAADKSKNKQNCLLYKNNTSGVPGVGWHSRDKVWIVRIGNGVKNISVGSFKNKEDAICARREAEKEYNYHENHGKREVA